MADASTADPGPCSVELDMANICISADQNLEACSCFTQPFSTTFPADLESAFQNTLGLVSPSSAEFCDASSENVCE